MQQYWSGHKGDYEFIPVRDLAEAFAETHIYHATQQALDAPCEELHSVQRHLNPLTTRKYAPLIIHVVALQ